MRRLCFVLPCALLLVACGGSSSSSAGPDDTGTGLDTTPPPPADSGLDAASDTTGDAPLEVASDAGDSGAAGSGTIAGTAGGKTYDTVLSAYWIGAPDVATTTAVYLVAKPIGCADISKSGWSHTIAAGTQVFEMLMWGSAPGTFKVNSAASNPGDVEVNALIAAPTKSETRGNAGTVTLTTLTATTEAKGTFSVQFPDGTSKLDGTFDAVYCPTGHEP